MCYNESMKKGNKLAAFTNGLCALIWTAKVIMDFLLISKESKYFTLIVVLDVVCAIMWIINFFVWCRNSKNDDE